MLARVIPFDEEVDNKFSAAKKSRFQTRRLLRRSAEDMILYDSSTHGSGGTRTLPGHGADDHAQQYNTKESAEDGSDMHAMLYGRNNLRDSIASDFHTPIRTPGGGVVQGSRRKIIRRGASQTSMQMLPDLQGLPRSHSPGSSPESHRPSWKESPAGRPPTLGEMVGTGNYHGKESFERMQAERAAENDARIENEKQKIISFELEQIRFKTLAEAEARRKKLEEEESEIRQKENSVKAKEKSAKAEISAKRSAERKRLIEQIASSRQEQEQKRQHLAVNAANERQKHAAHLAAAKISKKVGANHMAAGVGADDGGFNFVQMANAAAVANATATTAVEELVKEGTEVSLVDSHAAPTSMLTFLTNLKSGAHRPGS
jgi:hypothetical protein